MSVITTDTHLFFYSGAEHWSNWHRTTDQFEDPNTGFMFDTSEGHFMWQKARFFNDEKIADRIARTRDAATVKSLGRQIKGYDDKRWECVRLGCMTYSCYLKYSQNKPWGEELKATGDRTLVEMSPTDRIWGSGIGMEDVNDVLTGRGIGHRSLYWPGRNLLGKALMTVRDLIQSAHLRS